MATVLVRNGTLSVGDFFICGAVFGKVRAMQNGRAARISNFSSLAVRARSNAARAYIGGSTERRPVAPRAAKRRV